MSIALRDAPRSSSNPTHHARGLVRRTVARTVIGLVWLPGLSCTDVVPLGSFGIEANPEPGPAASDAGPVAPSVVVPAPTNTAPPLELPTCLMDATPGSLNDAGPNLGPTETLTDWTWPGPMESMQWDLMIEQDVAERAPEDAPTGGYYWSHAFSFEQGVAGRVGIQSEGVYQADPPSSPIEITKMAVFWLSGPPLAAELGDILYPDARVAEVSIAGTDWLTIHARFDWQVCHTYRTRFAPHSSDGAGNVWYGAWIDDITDGVEVFLGRMLLSSEAGAVSPFTSFRTTPIDFVPVEACDVTTPVSALFGNPTTGDGQTPTAHTNRFSSAPRCGTSRFTDFPSAVRHELAVVP